MHCNDISKATGILRAVQNLLGHTNIENTIWFLGMDVDDALMLSDRIDIELKAGLWLRWGLVFPLDLESASPVAKHPETRNVSNCSGSR